MAAILYTLLACSSMSMALSSPNPINEFERNLNRQSEVLGGVLAWLIRPGMTHAQVDWLVGKCQFPAISMFDYAHYPMFGLTIVSDDGIVVSVDYHPPKPRAAGQGSTSARTAVLDKVIGDVLTSPSLKELRLHYTKEERKRFTLINNPPYGLCWPADYNARIPGYESEVKSERDTFRPVASVYLGIRLDKCDLDDISPDPFDGNVVVTLLSAGNRGAEEADVSGTTVNYLAVKSGEDWDVRMLTFRIRLGQR
jgi:hypothetical protein